MSGYLRRLVQRTLQSAPAIRSTARLPYEPLPAMNEIESILPDDPVTMIPRQIHGAPFESPLENPDKTPFVSDTLPVLENNPGMVPVREQSTIFAKDSPTGSEPGKQPSAVRQADAGHGTVKERPRGTRGELLFPNPMQPQISTPHATAFNVSMLDDFEPLVKTVVRPDHEVDAQTSLKVFEPATSESDLLPDSPRQHFSGLWGQPIKSIEMKAPDTNEVHVTIGRIEITALHMPSPPKPAQAPPRKTPSLDEYLAKRDGGRS